MRFAYAQGDVKVNIKCNEDLTSSEYYYLMIAGVVTECGIARIVIPRTSLNRITRLSEVATTTGERYEKVAGIDVNVHDRGVVDWLRRQGSCQDRFDADPRAFESYGDSWLDNAASCRGKSRGSFPETQTGDQNQSHRRRISGRDQCLGGWDLRYRHVLSQYECRGERETEQKEGGGHRTHCGLGRDRSDRPSNE